MTNVPPFNLIDTAALLIVVFGTWLGFRRGLSGELARLAGVVAAFALGIYFREPISLWLVEHTRVSGQPAQALAFVGPVLAILLLTIPLRFLLKRLFELALPEKLDRVGGIFAGLVRSVVSVLIVFVLMNLWPHDYLNLQFGEGSLIGRAVVRVMPALRERVEDLPVTERVRERVKGSAEDAAEILQDERAREAARRLRRDG